MERHASQISLGVAAISRRQGRFQGGFRPIRPSMVEFITWFKNASLVSSASLRLHHSTMAQKNERDDLPDLEKRIGVRDDDAKGTRDQAATEKGAARPKLESNGDERFVTADDLRRIGRKLSGSKQGKTTSALYTEDEMRRLTRALSSKGRGKSAKSGEEDGLDIDGILGRIFRRDDTATDAKRLGVSFQNLVVDGEGFGATEGKTMGAVVSNFWPPNMIKNARRSKQTPVKRLINDFSGVVESGGAQLLTRMRRRAKMIGQRWCLFSVDLAAAAPPS